MITLGGLIRFWCGAVLIGVSGTVMFGMVLAQHHRPHAWLIAAGAGTGCLLLCLLLLVSRVSDWPQPTELPTYAGLIGGVFYGLVKAGLDRTTSGWLIVPIAAYILGFILIYSLGDYEDRDWELPNSP